MFAKIDNIVLMPKGRRDLEPQKRTTTLPESTDSFQHKLDSARHNQSTSAPKSIVARNHVGGMFKNMFKKIEADEDAVAKRACRSLGNPKIKEAIDRAVSDVGLVGKEAEDAKSWIGKVCAENIEKIA
ncbi:MAG: hypothetical protein ABH871_01555 [Pseudomonadota bacterium]